MEKDTNEYRAEKQRQEQKLVALLLGRLQNSNAIVFDINQVKAGFEAVKGCGIENLKNKAK